MPAYDFRCQNCATEFTLQYKSISAYDQATPHCPQCDSVALDRIIRRVAVQGTKSHDFASMSSDQMLSVLESGDKNAVETMVKQVGDTAPKSKPERNKPVSNIGDSTP